MAGKEIISFNATAYIKAVSKKLKIANQDIRDDILEAMKWELRDTTFKKNPVQLANGTVTSDADRKAALLRSFAIDTANWITQTYLRSAITAMATNFKDSHIGLYYEFGTGTENKTSNYEHLGEWNPFRLPSTGAAIVTRSAHVGMLSGMFPEKSAWRDIGGNMRITGSRRGGEFGEKFRRYIGDDVKAYHWFANAVANTDLQRRAKNHILKAFRAVNITHYFTVADNTGIFTLGKD